MNIKSPCVELCRKAFLKWAVNWEFERNGTEKRSELWGRQLKRFVFSLFLFPPVSFIFSRCWQMLWPRKQMYVAGWTRFEVTEVIVAGEAAAEKSRRFFFIYIIFISLPAVCVSELRVIWTACGVPRCVLISSVTNFQIYLPELHFFLLWTAGGYKLPVKIDVCGKIGLIVEQLHGK